LASYTGGATTGKFTVQQNAGSVTPPTGFTKYLGITSSTTTSASATDIYTFSQIIEGNNIADLLWGTANAKSVTLSFWIRSSTTGTFGGNIRNQNGDRSYPFTYTISSANTWEKKTITIAGETTGTWQTDNSQGIYIWFNIQVGSNFTLSSTGAWQSSGAYGASGCTNLLTSSGATLYITGVQLEAGTSATDFEFLPYDVNLRRCFRYFYSTIYINGANSFTAPTTNGLEFDGSRQVFADVTGYRSQFIQHPVTMRTTPSIAFFNGNNSGTSGQFFLRLHSGATQNFSGFTQAFQSHGFNFAGYTGISIGGSGEQVGIYNVHYKCDSEL
jgi:hypothetical protein